MEPHCASRLPKQPPATPPTHFLPSYWCNVVFALHLESSLVWLIRLAEADLHSHSSCMWHHRFLTSHLIRTQAHLFIQAYHPSSKSATSPIPRMKAESVSLNLNLPRSVILSLAFAVGSGNLSAATATLSTTFISHSLLSTWGFVFYIYCSRWPLQFAHSYTETEETTH